MQHPLVQKARVTVLNPMGQPSQQLEGEASSRSPLTLQTESIWHGHCVSVQKDETVIRTSDNSGELKSLEVFFSFLLFLLKVKLSMEFHHLCLGSLV